MVSHSSGARRDKYVLRLEHIVLHLVGIDPSGVLGFLMTDFDCWGSSSRGCCVGKELSLNTSVHCTEQECRAINGLRHSQNAVVLENDCLVLPERFSDPSTLFVRKNNTSEVVIDGVVAIKPVSISIAIRSTEQVFEVLGDGSTCRHPGLWALACNQGLKRLCWQQSGNELLPTHLGEPCEQRGVSQSQQD